MTKTTPPSFSPPPPSPNYADLLQAAQMIVQAVEMHMRGGRSTYAIPAALEILERYRDSFPAGPH